MNSGAHRTWLWLVLAVGAVYLIAGLAFAALAAEAASHRWVVVSRLVAWLVSFVAFGTHIAIERVGRASPPRTTAWHAALAVAAGAFALAAAANIHALRAGTGNHVLLAIALLAWPVGTALPAFFVAWAAAQIVRRRQQPL
jgi:hypothetical protein